MIEGKYNLQESTSTDYAVRTRLNVSDSDGTLILKAGRLEGGTALTVQTARSLNKPILIIDLDKPPQPGQVGGWVDTHNIRVMNIAGPRESKQPGIYDKAFAFIEYLLKR